MKKFTYDRSRFARLSAQAESSRLSALATNAAFLALREEVASARRACQIHHYDPGATKLLIGDRASLQTLLDKTPDLNDLGIRAPQLRALVGLLEQLDYATADVARTSERSKQQSALVERLEAFIQ